MATKKHRKTRLVLLDSHAIIHRAYHGMPAFTNSQGVPTGGLYGLITMILRIVSELTPDYVVACYDLPKPTFRHIAYDAYKAGRGKADDDLIQQIKSSRDIFHAFSIPIYEAEGFEADDCLGTIVEELKNNDDVEIIIASGDMDTMQLISGKQVQVYTLKKGFNDTILYDEEAMKARFGFAPEFLPDYKGLRGDTSDNIPGIRGIGEKTGAVLISEFHTIEDLYKELKKSDTRFKDLGITPRIIELLRNGEDEALFSKTLATIRRDVPIQFVLPTHTFLESLVLQELEDVCVKYEFRSLLSRVRKLVEYDIPEDSVTIKSNDVSEISDIQDQDEIKKTAIAVWLLNSEITDPKIDDIYMFGKSTDLRTAQKNLLEKIKKDNLSFVYESIELPIVHIVERMEKQGVLIDRSFFKRISTRLHKEIKELEKEIWKQAGHEFNINSPKQLGVVLYDELALGGKKIKKTEGGARTTKESELQKMKDTHPIISPILEYREMQKLLSTYIDTLPTLADADNRIHSVFSQTGTTTGRFSSNNPNLQNIPTREGLGKEIRKGFVAPKGSVLLSCDYSQIELRIAAILAKDEYLADTFRKGEDIHAAVAAKVFGVEHTKVTSDMRRKAKVINFGILYGMGVTALQQNLGTTRAEAQEFHDAYFIQFPKIAGYLESVVTSAKRLGYTETLFGRRRHFPGIKSPIPFVRAMAERMAINAPVQGTAADVVKLGMLRAHEALAKHRLLDKVRLIMQVHDELVYEVDESVVEQAQKIITTAMEEAIPKEFLEKYISVPLAVSAGTGKDWSEVK